jgi:multidrug efflux pump subunit AcrB
LQSVARIVPINTPTEVDHYQIRRVVDVFVMPKSEDLSGVNSQVQHLLKGLTLPKNARVRVQGAVVAISQSFARFGVGLLLSIVLVYPVLMAQFRSFTDPFIILTAIPPGLAGSIIFLWMTHTTLNIMSLMGVIMMTGIVVSNSILIVEFSGILHDRGMELKQAVVAACNVRLRPILMTSLGTLLALLPDGTRRGGGPRTIRPAGSRDDWRLGNIRATDRLSRARGLPGDSPQGSRCGGGFVTRLAPPLPCLCRRNVFCSGTNIRPKHVDIDEHGPAGGY